ncbi:MAG TPA: response regulator, partial [Terriglobia bacterium]|nr:response regulator [Terriglobia bacterium]
LLTQFFTSRGYRVCWADRAATCLDALDEFPDVRVVLLDLSVGGTELLRHIKMKKPDVEVIMMTGQGQEGLAKRSISLGAFAHLPKPLDVSIMEKLVGVCVKQQDKKGEST